MYTRVLAIDDEPDFTTFIKVGLETHGGFVVREENDSNNAVAAAAEFEPHVILLDIMMPGLDGGDLLAMLKQQPRTADVPVILLTALVGPGDAIGHHLLSAGHLFLPKPVEIEEVISSIKECLQPRLENSA